jgi:hypothetical protein
VGEGGEYGSSSEQSDRPHGEWRGRGGGGGEGGRGEYRGRGRGLEAGSIAVVEKDVGVVVSRFLMSERYVLILWNRFL